MPTHLGAVVPHFDPHQGTTTAVISRSSSHRARSLRAAFPAAEITELGTQPPSRWPQAPVSPPSAPSSLRLIVGEPEAWLADWALLTGLRRSADLVFEGVSLAELRMLSGQRALPPLMLHAPGRAILLTPTGAMSRVDFDVPSRMR